MLHSDKETVVLSIFVGLFMIGMFSIPFFVVNKYQKKHNVVHTYDTVYDSTFRYIITDSMQASIDSIVAANVKEIITSDSIRFANMNIPVVEVNPMLLAFGDDLDNIVLYKSNINIPYFVRCKNINYISSKINSYLDFCFCPSFEDLKNLKYLEIYGNGMLKIWGERDNFLCGCESLETVIISGFSSVVLHDDFKYCTNLKTVIFQEVGRLYIRDGFNVSGRMCDIIIKGDTTGREIEIEGISNKIVYMN